MDNLKLMLANNHHGIDKPEVWGGLECTINRVNDQFFDQLLFSGFYATPDVKVICDTGIKKLRFPVLWEKHQPAKDGIIDWTWTKGQLQYFRDHQVDVIAGLVHHGSGPAFTSLLDPEFPYLLAEYAGKVAAEFPWINYYTPVNEPLTTARFSGLYSIWYPHHSNDRSFLIMLINQLKGVVLSMQEIRKINPAAKLVQTEDLGKVYSTPLLQYQANFENKRRWLTFDLLCGMVDEKHPLWKYFRKHGIEEENLRFFLENKCVPDLFGFNHYVTSERFLDEKLHLYPEHTHGGNLRHNYADIEAVRVEVDEETGIEVLLREAWERYHQPIAVTEVHLHCHREEQIRWFRYVWDACTKLKTEGIELVAVTAWALFGSYGWNKLLTVPNGDYEPGVFDLRNGYPRPTALAAYLKKLTSSVECIHPISQSKGWWQRESRYLHEPLISEMKAIRHSKNKIQPVLIIGRSGTLGRAFAKLCDHRAIFYNLSGRQDCDIAEMASVEAAIDKYRPWAVINAAGFVRVDDAEAEKEACFRENLCGPYNLAFICQRRGIKLVTFSTDLVFDGRKKTPYIESDPVAPLNVYGRSKADAEEQVLLVNPSALIVRTSAFFGPWDQYNFLHWVEMSLLNRQVVTVARDVHISPTYVPDLVHAVLDLLIDDESGIWHLANRGSITWADLAHETARRFGLDTSGIHGLPLSQINYPAPRPRYCVLGSERGSLMPGLDHALNRYFEEKKKLVEW